MQNQDILIIGAGLSGLTAAKVLKNAGRKVKILEASDGIGGRVRTDEKEGYLMDRGFQVLLTDYPECKRFLDYKALDLHKFKPGAIILNERGSSTIGDPLREPAALFETLLSPAGSIADKIRMLGLKFKLAGKSVDRIFSEDEITTIAYLRNAGFSKQMLDQFFIPFMTGIFLEDQLTTSSRMFEFVFKMFSEGNTTLPAKGMGMISAQLGLGLTSSELQLNEKVLSINGSEVLTASGRSYSSDLILIATDAPGLPKPYAQPRILKNSVISIYFTSDTLPFRKPVIALNANKNKLVNNICVMNSIAPGYAPQGKWLIAVSIIKKQEPFNETELCRKVKDELNFWYPDALHWQPLRTYQIPYALPEDAHVVNELSPAALRLTDQSFICGDHLLNGSINAAMKSGRMAAEAILSI